MDFETKLLSSRGESSKIPRGYCAVTIHSAHKNEEEKERGVRAELSKEKEKSVRAELSKSLKSVRSKASSKIDSIFFEPRGMGRFHNIAPSGEEDFLDKCWDADNSSVVAVKSVRRGPDKKGIPTEVLVLDHMRAYLGAYQNIIKYFDVIENPVDKLSRYVVYEHCSDNLVNFARSSFSEAGVPEEFLWNAFGQMAKAIAFVRRANFFHGDVTGHNFLVAPSGSGELYPTIKLSGFANSGWDPYFGDPDRPHIKGLKPGKIMGQLAYDVWGLGSTIHELARGIRVEAPPSASDETLWGDKGSSHYRIDRLSRDSAGKTQIRYSKLMNYFMMRCLQCLQGPYCNRIDAYELATIIPNLDDFAHQAFAFRYEDFLERFNDGHDDQGNFQGHTTDMIVLRQIAGAALSFAKTTPDLYLDHVTVVQDMVERLRKAEGLYPYLTPCEAVNEHLDPKGNACDFCAAAIQWTLSR